MSRMTELPWSLCAALLGAVFLGNGCTTFEHDWKEEAKKPDSQIGLEGCWQGVWLSKVNGHTDKLRCVIQQTEPGTYRARFRANYQKVFRFGYTVKLNAEPTEAGF